MPIGLKEGVMQLTRLIVQTATSPKFARHVLSYRNEALKNQFKAVGGAIV